MATQPKYSSTDIVKENVFFTQKPDLSPLYKGCFVTMGGSNLNPNEVMEGIQSLDELSNIIADSTSIDLLEHKFLTPTKLIGVKKLISNITSHQITFTNQIYASGTVTCSKVSHGLAIGSFYAIVKGIVPEQYNSGVKLVTVLDADTVTFDSTDFGEITDFGTLECASGTATDHGMPTHSVFYGQITGVTPSALSGAYPIAYINKDDFYYPAPYTNAIIKLVKSGITTALATVPKHGLPIKKLIPANVINVGVSGYNGAKVITAFDINTICWAADSKNLTPAFARSKISTVLITATGHGFETGITTGVTITSATPVIYNGAKSAYIIDENTLAYRGVPHFMGTATETGSLLDTQAAELYAMGSSFFAQNHRLPIAVLDLGNASGADNIAAFDDFLATNEKRFHAYALPAGFDVGFKGVALKYADIVRFPMFFMPTSLSRVQRYLDLDIGLYDLEATIESNSPNRSSSENVPAAKLAVYLNCYPSESSPMGQGQWQYVKGLTPYEFNSSNDSDIQDFKDANLTYVVDCAEGGIAENAFINSCLMASSPANGKIDSIAKWAINYVKTELDRTFAAAIFASSNDATKRLKLNNQDGRQTFKTLKTIGQGEIDRFVREGVIDSINKNDNGTVSNVTFNMMDYFVWARDYPQELADGNIESAASVTISIAARGITNLTLNIAVKFA